MGGRGTSKAREQKVKAARLDAAIFDYLKEVGCGG